MKVIRSILFIINLLLAVGLILTTLAGTVRPSQMLLPSLMAYGYLPLLLANVAMVLLWLLMKRWEFLLSVAAIALRWSMVGLFFQVGGSSMVPSREEHPQMVTLMDYNVHLFLGQGQKYSSEINDSIASGFLSLVKQHNPDVLCLQEFTDSKKAGMTDSLVNMGYSHHFSAPQPGQSEICGTVVFSKYPITGSTRIAKGKLLVEIQVNGHRMWVCAIHMGSYKFDETDREEINRMRHGEMQESSRRTLGKVKETILRHETEWEEFLRPVVTSCTVPLVLAGDLNDIPNSWLYSQIAKEMTDTYCEQGLGFCSTFNGGADRLLPFGRNWMPQFRIDMVFHSEGLKTLSYKRLKVGLSDHYPVLVALELEN